MTLVLRLTDLVGATISNVLELMEWKRDTKVSVFVGSVIIFGMGDE